MYLIKEIQFSSYCSKKSTLNKMVIVFEHMYSWCLKSKRVSRREMGGHGRRTQLLSDDTFPNQPLLKEGDFES